MTPYRATFKVRVYEAGPGGSAGPETLANYLQQSAAEHADLLGVGAEPMTAEGVAWILTRLKLRLERWPRMGEEVRIETWPAGLDRRFAVRAWRLRDAEGAALGAAIAHWAVFDVVRRRLAPLPAWLGERVRPGEPAPLDFAERSLAAPGEARYATRLSPRRGELDVNGHVNNAHLLGWLLEPLAGREERTLAEIDAAFRGEVRPDDTVESRAAPEADCGGSGHAWRHALSRGDDGTDLVRAVSRWV
jgi:acyl-ACP thioesterase